MSLGPALLPKRWLPRRWLTDRRLPYRWPAVGLAVGLVLLGLGVVLVAAGGEPSTEADAEQPTTVVERSLVAQPVDILRGWDERRAAAYAEGDLRALDALYVRGSRTGARDHRMLREYVDRGLRVTGLRSQLLRTQVLRHDPRRLVVLVTDRLVPAVAVGDDTDARLPGGGPRTRRVVMRASDAGWRVVETIR